MSREFFCSPRNWIYLLQNYFSSYVYLNDIYKTLKGIGKIQFVSELTILQESSRRKKQNCQSLNATSYVGKLALF